MNMSEFVSVPMSLWGIRSEIADASLSTLVDQGKLPADFEFRALAIEDDKERQRIALQDIKAALGAGEPSEHPYLTQELPDCVTVYAGGTKTRTEILRDIDVDYHQLGTLLHIAEEEGVQRYHGYQAWAGYIKHLDPAKYTKLEGIMEPGPQRGSFSKRHNFQHRLASTVIRDSALMPIYENPTVIPGHGPVKRGLLRLLLQDNHLDLQMPPES